MENNVTKTMEVIKENLKFIEQGLYTLDENKNVIPATLREWGSLFDSIEGINKRRVAEDEIDDKRISTVFLGVNHGFSIDLQVFETMVFDGKEDIYCDRYATWQEAIHGHNKAIQWVKEGCKDNED